MDPLVYESKSTRHTSLVGTDGRPPTLGLDPLRWSGLSSPPVVEAVVGCRSVADVKVESDRGSVGVLFHFT